MASLPLPALQWQPENSGSNGRASLVGTVPPARLSALEWSIVAMAQRDGLASIRERSRLSPRSAVSSGSDSRTASRMTGLQNAIRLVVGMTARGQLAPTRPRQ